MPDNILIDNNLQARSENAFFSTNCLFLRKESILSGGCGKNILTFPTSKQKITARLAVYEWIKMIHREGAWQAIK